MVLKRKVAWEFAFLRLRSAVPTPDGIAFPVAEDEGVRTLHDFAGEDEVGFALLNF